MRRNRGVVALAAMLSVLVGAPIASARPVSEGPGDKVTFLNLTSKEVQSQQIDLAPEGTFSLGDRFVFTNDLYRHGKKVGIDGGECLLVRLEPAHDTTPAMASFNCVATLWLPRGQITVQTLFTGPAEEGEEAEQPPVYLAITGGTQAYRNARGDAKLVFGDNGEARYYLRLIR